MNSFHIKRVPILVQGCYNQMETIFSPQKRQPLVGVRVTTENTVEHITLRKKKQLPG